MATLPKSDVSVESSVNQEEGKSSPTHSIAITARRDGKNRTWTGSSSGPNGAVREAVEKMLNDPMTGEYLP